MGRAWVGNLKQQVLITGKSSKFKGETQPYVVKLPKSVGARHYCPKIPLVPGTLGAHANSSPGVGNLFKSTPKNNKSMKIEPSE